jgi:hypothetical protein
MKSKHSNWTPTTNVHIGTFEELLQLDRSEFVFVRVLTTEEQEQWLLELPSASDLFQ